MRAPVRCMLKIAQAAAPSQSKTDHGHAHDHDTAHKKNEKPHRHTEAVVFVVRGLAFLCMGRLVLFHSYAMGH